MLLIVDGVHGLGVEDPKITALGCDAFAGRHPQMDVWAPRHRVCMGKARSLAENAPVIPSFFSLEPFEAVGTGTCTADSGTRSLVFTGRLPGFRTLLGVADGRSFSPEHRARSNHGAHTN